MISRLKVETFYLILCFILFITPEVLAQRRPLHQLVNPFIGTDAHGHTFPGATSPFGMVQLSPDTRLTGWDGCSGYHYTDTIIYGFSHTHLSGTGVSDYGDILLMPGNGMPVLKDYAFASSFKKENEKAHAGFYEVLLEKDKIKVELTATERAGMQRYSFANPRSAFVALDLVHRDQVLDASIEFISATEIAGHRRSKAWAEDQVVYFYIRFSRPFKECGTYSNGAWAGGGFRSYNDKDIRVYFSFDEMNEPLIVKTGISAVDIQGAKLNLDKDIPGWDFDNVRNNVEQKWDEALGKIEIETAVDSTKTIFYSALYHTMIAPNIFSDHDGRYRGMDKKIYTDDSRTQYTVFSLWDTYRALHPMYNIIERKRNSDFIKTMLDHYKTGGLLPVWELAANETFCMIGYHNVSVITDAWAKGIRDFDPELALQAMKHSASRDHFGLDVYRKYGHIAGDREPESVSKTLEYAYNDWCIAQFSAWQEQKETYNEYIQRAQYYKNIFDPSTAKMRPKLNGAWKDPFDPAEVDFHFTEANSYQYSFYVPQDIEALISLHGGMDAFEANLDDLFHTKKGISGRHQSDITGLIGQYAHGNEPSHHMAYLYNYIGKPWKTQEIVRQILTEQYSEQPDGLSGNEDCGQMSAWYILSSMGFYPVCPGSTRYEIGTPLFDKVRINLENGNSCVIEARNLSAGNMYIDRITIDGEEWPNSYMEHDDLMRGAHIVFHMSSKPNQQFAQEKKHRPVSVITDHPIVTVPWFSRAGKSFQDSIKLSIDKLPDAQLTQYRFVHQDVNTEWTEYREPLTIKDNVHLQARNLNRWGQPGHVVEAYYFKFNSNFTIEYKSKYSSQYTAGGPNGLIDGIRGNVDWRLGAWQGYQNQDFEAIVDLGKKMKIREIGAGFCQDIRSWIWYPVEIEYLVSNDGINFKRVALLRHDVADDDYERQIRDMTAAVKTKAKYVKVKAKNYGKIPEWHLGAGGQAHIFIDEIWVK